MRRLPLIVPNFLSWYFFKMPVKLYVVGMRIIKLSNNFTSFTLNLKLLVTFTPLFGDYTYMGRFIGFVIRIFQVIFGLIFVVVMTIISFVAPIIWLILPIILYYYIGWLVLFGMVVLFVTYALVYKDTPDLKVKNVTKGHEIKSFRPSTIREMEILTSSGFRNLDSFFRNSRISYLLKKLELINSDFINTLKEKIPGINTSEFIESAHAFALEGKTRYVEVEHLFLALIKYVPENDIFLAKFGLNFEDCLRAVSWILDPIEALSKVYFWQDDYEVPSMGGIGKGMTGRITPQLDSISTDLTKEVKAGKIKEIVAHKQVIDEVAHLLGGSKVNALIVGEPGSGKTSIVQGIAYEVIKGTKFDSLKFKRIVSLEPSALLSGTRSPGDIAEKMRKVLKEVEESGDIIIFIDEIHNLVAGSGNDSGVETSTAYSVLENALSQGRVQFVGATTLENYVKFIEPNESLTRLFQVVKIDEATPEETLLILEEFAKKFQQEQRVEISYLALKACIELSNKLIHERVLPDKAIDILNRSVLAVSGSSKFVTRQDVAQEISRLTQVPVGVVEEDEGEKLLNIDQTMMKRVIGQDDAIKQIAAALKRARVGIRDESKPIASFLFVGTTGVGKTETAKALARNYFGDEKAMIRLDMSEYQQQDSINRLIGNPDASSKGILTEAIRKKPFSLILLDEIEKAYPSILLAFLQVLDDGRLTDSTGRTVDFTNSIIIATSNVGTREIQEIAQNNGDFIAMKEAAMASVHNQFAPEFLNRFTGIIVFRPLTMQNVSDIANILLDSVRKIAQAQNLKISFTQPLIEELVRRGYNPQMGARPLKRVIEEYVETYLADKILAKELNRGDVVELGVEVFGDDKV